MKEVITKMDLGLVQSLLVIFVGFALYVIGQFRSHINKTLEKHSKEIKSHAAKHTKDLDEFEKKLSKTTDDFSKAATKINDRSNDLTDTLAKAQISIQEEIHQTKLDIVKLNKAISQVAENVVRYRADLESDHGKINFLEKYVGKNKEDIGKVVQIVETVKQEYGKVKLVAEKNRKQTEATAKALSEIEPTITNIKKLLAKASAKKRKA